MQISSIFRMSNTSAQTQSPLIEGYLATVLTIFSSLCWIW